jgi:uncharacterized protein
MSGYFIQLFKTPNGMYFFDANKNEIVPIGIESFKYLSNQTAVKTQELFELEKEGYLSTKSLVEEVRHPYTNYIEIFLTRKLEKLTLQLTQDCNFRCTYCAYSGGETSRQRGHSPKRMDWDMAKRGIDFLWNHSVDSKSVNIGLYGGEPLLEFALIKQVIEYSRKLFDGKEITYNITTNGTLLTDEMIYYFQDNNIAVSISLDGVKEINDKNRVFVNGEGTYDAVMANIERIKEIAPELASKLQIIMVINPENDFDCVNSIYIEGSDFFNYNVNASLVDLDYENKKPFTSEDYASKYEYQYFLSILEHFGRANTNMTTPLTQRAVASMLEDTKIIANGSSLRTVNAPAGPCIPGKMRLFVNVDGNFYPCERVSETSLSMIIGNIENGFDFDKAKQALEVGSLTQEECIKCWGFAYCDMCVKKADAGEDTLSSKHKLLSCNGTRSGIHAKMKCYLLVKEVPEYYPHQIREVE